MQHRAMRRYLFGNKKLQICRYALAQPKVLPPCWTDEITEPLMCQLVSDRHDAVYIMKELTFVFVSEQYVVPKSQQIVSLRNLKQSA